MKSLIELPRYKKCFVCGKENPIGLDIIFYAQEDKEFYADYPDAKSDKKVVFEFTPTQAHIGWKNTMHGGIIASLLDESMFWAVAVNTSNIYLTTELNVRYVKAVSLPVIIKGTAWSVVKKPQSRMQTAIGELRSSEGELLAKAEAKYFAIPKDKTAEFLEDMYFESEPDKPIRDINDIVLIK